MAEPNPLSLSKLATRARYIARQGTRVGWYAGQAYRMRRMQQQAVKRDPSLKTDVKPPQTKVPGVPELLRGVAALSARDLSNIETGLYPAPREDERWVDRIRDARAFFADAPEVARRRAEKRHQEAREAPQADKRPRYYQQNFHFQTDGWMSDESARLYDTQVEVLFTGATAAMRRMGLVPVANWMKGKDQRHLRAVDLATGPGNFADALAQAYPRMPLMALDLSEAYANHAVKRFKRYRHQQGMVAKAEEMPFGEASLDLTSSVFLFHELPPKIRVAVAEEIARVLKPGGLFVFVDSLQPGDTPAYDGLLELFPQLFHEPYYTTYATTDLIDLFQSAGLKIMHEDTAFFSKVLAFEKPF
ncbi:class I SAM-dependent methyltransferase [Ahrensia marina]|uniref:class I SAM-dependent methyltransferase n=1 Tax=Ahrensia marina TaxID=1514904 RepID=UPI0035D06C7D